MRHVLRRYSKTVEAIVSDLETERGDLESASFRNDLMPARHRKKSAVFQLNASATAHFHPYPPSSGCLPMYALPQLPL
jgi:hypothetical protein